MEARSLSEVTEGAVTALSAPVHAKRVTKQALKAQLSALTKLRSFARFVQAGLLAFHLARVARQKAGALQRHAQARIGLDERTRDAVPNCARLSGRTAALHADANVVRPLRVGDLQRRQRERP